MLVSEIDGALSAALAFRPITEEQHDAWRRTAAWIRGWTHSLPPEADHWLVLMEYAPPLITTRPDILIVADEHVVVCEAKTGEQRVGAAARRQALGYAADLFWFHPGARGRSLVPIVVTSRAVQRTAVIPTADTVPQASDVRLLNDSGVRDLLLEIASRETGAGRWVDPDQWQKAAYAPRPSIVDAAVALFAATEDEGVTAALSDDDELSRLTDLLIAEVHLAATMHEHRVLLVSGVPGAGKTLIGLRLAHDPSVIAKLRNLDSQPLFLTGNGPLVKVLVEALARDFHRRKEVTMAQARREAGVLVKLVHSFTRAGLSDDSGLDVPHVAIFDEGQRVWDAEQMARKHDVEVSAHLSEPEVILQRLEKRDWAVVVVLVGDGQEINTGETGAQLWIDAIAARRGRGTREWIGLAPGHLADTEVSGVEQRAELFLEMTRRSVGATWLSQWVSSVLENRPEEASALAASAADQEVRYPILVTRDLDAARSWLRGQSKHARAGLLASARAGRLRAYGLETQAEFQGGIDWPKWFLDRPPSLSSSSALEVVATEFKCQGLELDYVGLAWSWDFVRGAESWSTRRLMTRDLIWRATSGEKRRFAINAYRVLLTRARSGLVIWVPVGAEDDPTRNPTEMDAVAEYLLECGAKELELPVAEPITPG